MAAVDTVNSGKTRNWFSVLLLLLLLVDIDDWLSKDSDLIDHDDLYTRNGPLCYIRSRANSLIAIIPCFIIIIYRQNEHFHADVRIAFRVD